MSTESQQIAASSSIPQKNYSFFQIAYRLTRSLDEFWLPTLLTPVLVLLELVMEISIPFFAASLIDRIKDGTSIDIILRSALPLVLIALASLVCGIAAGVTCSDAAAGLARNLRRDIFARIQDFSFENIDRFSSASLVTRLTTDITNVQQAFMMIIRLAIRAPLLLIFACIMAYLLVGPLALVYLVAGLIFGIGLAIMIHAVLPVFKRVFKRYDFLNESIEENIRGIRVVKSYAREDHEFSKFERAARRVFDDFFHAEKLLAYNVPLMRFAIFGTFTVVIFFGSKLIITSRGSLIDVGQLSALTVYGFQILISLTLFSLVFVLITLAEESAKRICEVLEEKSTLTNPENPIFEIADGSVDFDHVSFGYGAHHSGNLALIDIDLHIKSGQTVGILGGTGSAKSSLVQLICRLYDTTKGSVKVGGRDVRSYDLTSLRDQVAVVLQKNQLFSGTIKENLRWGNKDASDQELVDACKIACADEFIKTFEKGYDTYIEQGGSNVSGGQKQRLCIARALLKKPKVLILDDSTSAVDTKTDAHIRNALRNYLPDTSKFIISQRVSSIQDADIILVMEGGRIASKGTHEELLQTSKIYRETFASQTKAQEEGKDYD